MKTREINDIVFNNKAWRRIKKNNKRLPVAGLDTETENGRAFIIGCKTKDSYYRGIIESFKDFIDFIVKHELDTSINFFYNLTYDYQALIKHLSHRHLREIAYMNETIVDNIKLKIIPDKKFIVTYNKKFYEFYDLAQFYGHQSLDNASRRILHKHKNDLGNIDITSLSLERFKKERVYRNILSYYLMIDCELCYGLGEHLYDISSKFLKPKYFYSQASPSQQYFLENMTRNFNALPMHVLEYGLKAYNGGRFEVFKRGTFKNVSTYDIRSAYPYHNANIPALDKGYWRETKEYDPEALISLFKVEVQGESHISPLRHETKEGLLFYPVGKKTCYINKREYETILRYGYKIRIIDGYNYYDPEPEYPFLFLKKFYEEKEKVGKDHPEYMFYKLIINGFYGKTIQLEPDKELTEDSKKAIDMFIEDGVVRFITQKYKAGLLFNPVIAQEITANTRCQLLDAVVDCQESVIAFATDSIITTKKPDVKIGKELGEWDREIHNKTFTSIGSGVYFYEGQQKMKFRGFGRGYNPEEVFSDIEGDTVSLPVTRNLKLKQVVRQGDLSLDDDFNIIRSLTKSLNLNFDKKREWLDRFDTVKDIYEKQIESRPLRV